MCRTNPPTQVTHGFDDGTENMQTDARAVKRRRVSELMPILDAEVADSNLRCLAWAKRASLAEGSGIPWRKKLPVFRTASKNWCADSDGQIRTSSPLSGWAHFSRSTNDEEALQQSHWEASRWREWPHMNVGLDLGPDGLTGSSALLDKFQCNITRWPDFDHGMQRALVEALKGVYQYDLWMLMAVSWNFKHGPKDNDYRWHQLGDLSATMRKKYTPHTCALFQERLPMLKQELENLGIELPGEDPTDVEVWKVWQEREILKRKGSRMFTNRFLALIDKPKQETPWWTWDLFEREMLGLELGLLNKKKFSHMMALKAQDFDNGGESGGPLGGKHLNIEDKTLRAFADEAICISVALLADPSNKRMVEMFLCSTKHVVEWRSHMAREMRSAETTRKWLTAQVGGGIMDSIQKGLTQLGTKNYLDLASFKTSAGTQPCDIEDCDVECEDEFADLAWRFEQSLASARLVRLLHLFGWPHRWVGILHSNELAGQTFDDFKEDIRIYLKLGALDHATKKVDNILKRHLFQHTSNLQFRVVCAELGFGPIPDPAFVEFVTKRFSGLIATTICEEQVGCAKNAGEVKTSNKYRKPEVSMHKVLQHSFAKRFRFEMPTADKAAPRRTVRLPDDAFRPKRSDWSLPFEQIQSCKRDPDFVSPSATNISAPVADLSMLRHADYLNDLNLIEKASMGGLFSFQHMFIMQCEVPSPDDGPPELAWLLAWKHLHNSSVLCCRMKKTEVPFTAPPLIFFEQVIDEKPLFASIFSLSQIKQACKIRIRSWLWQKKHCAFGDGIGPGVRVFQEGPCKRVEVIMAEDGWYTYSRDQLLLVANDRGVAIPSGSSVLETARLLNLGILKCSELAAVELAGQRLARLSQQNQWVKELMCIDEAMELLDREEYQQMNERQKKRHGSSGAAPRLRNRVRESTGGVRCA